MREAEPSYHAFPTALEWVYKMTPNAEKERRAQRTQWFYDMDLVNGRDYIFHNSYVKGGSTRQRVDAIAFANRAHALQFKLIFA